MQRFIVILGALLIAGIGVSSATNTAILNHSYTVDGNNVKIFRTNNSDGGNVDINVQNPDTNDWLNFGTAKISDQVFSYTKQRDGEQNIQLVPDNGGDIVQFTINGINTATATRTVIPVVPKAGPSGNTIMIILSTIIIFSGYIYIKKRADI